MAKKGNALIALQGWLAGLLASVIRPIIEESIEKGLGKIREAAENRRAFEEIDAMTQELSEEMARAESAEERWAILEKIKRNRAGVFNNDRVSDTSKGSAD